MKDYPVIISSIVYLYIVLNLVIRMSVEDDSLSHLDILLQKTLRYKHHKQNYLRSTDGLTPTGLKLQKKPAFVPISEDFSIK